MVVLKAPADMLWGQRFAIVCDPDGHRVGLKAALVAVNEQRGLV